MDWPTERASRLRRGPRAFYWQQRADYTIVATLDTGAKTIRGWEHQVHQQLAGHCDTSGCSSIRISIAQPAREPRLSPATRESRQWISRGYDVTGIEVNGRTAVGRVDER
jgi:hypothetical protein